MKRITSKVVFAKVALATMALLAIVLIAGCAKFKDLGVYDKTVPEDQLCTLEIAGGLYVREFNGKKVGSNFLGTIASGWGLKYGYNVGSAGYATIKIPAGNHTLLVNFYMNDFGTSYTVKDLSISHNFTAGNTYLLTALLHKANGDVQDTWTGSSAVGAKSISLSIIDKSRLDKAFDDAFGK